MKKRISGFIAITKKTVKEWMAGDPFKQSAAIAYYAIFSLPALLVLIINIVGFFFEKEAVSGEISRQVGEIMGEDSADFVGNIVTKAGEIKAGLIPGIIAVITIITGATGVFGEMQKSLDLIWGVKQKAGLSIGKKIKSWLSSFGLVISVGFMMLISLVFSSVLAAVDHWVENVLFNGASAILYVMEFIVSISVITALFAIMFKFLPDVKIKLRNVWSGAILTAVLFIIGKYGLSIYFGKAHPASVYGAAGSIILIMLWAFYSSAIVFFGAQFTRQYALYHKIKIAPNKLAEPIEDHASLNDAENDEKNAMRKEEILKSEKKGEKSEKKAKEHQKIYKIKTRKQLAEKIKSLESRLDQDKDNIKDDFKISHLFRHFIPGFLRVKQIPGKKITLNDYLQNMAQKHITEKPEKLMTRFKKLMNVKSDGSIEKNKV